MQDDIELRERVFVSIAAAGAEFLSENAAQIYGEMDVDYGPSSLSGAAFLESLTNLHTTTAFYFRVKKRFRRDISHCARELCNDMEGLLTSLRDEVIQPIKSDLQSGSLFSSSSQEKLRGEGKGMSERFPVEMSALLTVSNKSRQMHEACCSAYPELLEVLSNE